MSARRLSVRVDVTGIGDRDVAEVLTQMEAAGFIVSITRTDQRHVHGMQFTLATASVATVAGRSVEQIVSPNADTCSVCGYSNTEIEE